MCQYLTPSNLYILGAVLFLLVILILFRRRQPNNIVAYKTEKGNVTINRSAVVELVRTSCKQISQINRPKLKVFVRKGLTHFTISIQLTSGGRLKDVEETLQNHLRESLSKNLGIENLGDINVIVTSFKSGKVRPLADTSTAIDYTVPVTTKDEFEKSLEDTDASNDSEKH